MSNMVIFSLDEDCHIGNIAAMEQIRKWRRANEISLDQAGALIGVSGVQWHRYEAGTRRIPAEKVAAVSEATGISPSDLRPDIFGPAPRPERQGAVA